MSSSSDNSNAIKQMQSRRLRIGAASLICLGLGAIGLIQAGGESAWAAACIRVAIVLGAVWLCLPTTRRPAAWAALTPPRLAVLVLAAIAAHRLKFVLPVMAIAGALSWVLRPRGGRRT